MKYYTEYCGPVADKFRKAVQRETLRAEKRNGTWYIDVRDVRKKYPQHADSLPH